MPIFTQQQLANRTSILKTHIDFGKLLDSDMINALIHLFDDKTHPEYKKLSQYIKEEFINQGINTDDITIVGKVYGQDRGDPSLDPRAFQTGIFCEKN